MKRFSASDLQRRRAQGESWSDLGRVRRKSEAELEADIAGDEDFQDVPADWVLTAQAVIPVPKKLLSLRLDSEVVDWFKAQGPGYQTKINSVLRTFVKHQGGGRKRG